MSAAFGGINTITIPALRTKQEKCRAAAAKHQAAAFGALYDSGEITLAQHYIKGVTINAHRNIDDIRIDLNQKKRTHLILTGKNGSGKTTVLREMNDFLEKMFTSQGQIWLTHKRQLTKILERLQASDLSVEQKENLKLKLDETTENLNKFSYSTLEFDNLQGLMNDAAKGEFIVAFFDAKRSNQLVAPTGINKVELKAKYNSAERANKAFIQYIVNLKAERSFARDDGDIEAADTIENWFTNLEKNLGEIFDEPGLRLVFDRKKYNFNIAVEGKQPYSLTQLSDGQSAILHILTELLLRMESKSFGKYDIQGIAFIDEIETHLHVELQKKILPFLIDFFPNIQFVVTTHSPFVLSSVSNAIVCDLQNKMIVEDLSGYSYDSLIESYFQSDKYSKWIKEKVNQYALLSESPEGINSDSYKNLKKYLHSLPKYHSPELDVRIQQIELSLINKSKDN